MNIPISFLYNSVYGSPGTVLGITVMTILVSVLGGKNLNRMLLAVYAGAMLYLTVLSRSAGRRRANLNLFWSYRYLLVNDYFQRQILYNICIFVPLGMIVSQLTPRWKNVIILPLVSVGIEILQFITGRGLCELDDLISNSIGGIIGFSFGMLFVIVRDKRRTDRM